MNTSSKPLKHERWHQVTSRQRVFDGHFKVDALTVEYVQYNGQNAAVEREQITREDAVSIVAYDPKLNEVVLVEQIRVGCLEQDNGSAWLKELPAGLIDAGETPIEAAKRELLEETGLEGSSAKEHFSYFTTPGGFTEKIHVISVSIDLSGQPDAWHKNHEQEDILVLRVQPEVFLNQVINGEVMTSAPTLIGLQHALGLKSKK